MRNAAKQIGAFLRSKNAPKIKKIPLKLYQIHFHFKTAEEAGEFHDQVTDAIADAIGYKFNYGEPIRIEPLEGGKTVIIVYGKENED